MFDAGQLVRIRERTWQVLEDHAGHGSNDHTLRVRGEDGEVRGVERTFIYSPIATSEGEDAFEEDGGLERVELLKAPELLWRPGTPPSMWELGLTDFLGGCKLEREHPTGGHHAKRTTGLHKGIQAGSGTFSAEGWEIAGAHCT